MGSKVGRLCDVLGVHAFFGAQEGELWPGLGKRREGRVDGEKEGEGGGEVQVRLYAYARSLQTRRPTILLPSGSFDLQFITILRGFVSYRVVRLFMIQWKKVIVGMLSHNPR